jgi:hypothetical protein
MAERVSQEVVEATYSPSDTKIRSSQEVVEAVYLPSATRIRASQTVVEVVYVDTGISPTGVRYFQAMII